MVFFKCTYICFQRYGFSSTLEFKVMQYFVKRELLPAGLSAMSEICEIMIQLKTWQALGSMGQHSEG